MEGIADYEMPKPFDDESFRLIDNDKNDTKSDSEQNSVESDNVDFDFIYDEEIALVVERTKRWFDKFDNRDFKSDQIQKSSSGDIL